MENITEILKKIKADAAFGKKKHFNAAERKQFYHYWIGVPLVVVNLIMGTTLFITLTENAQGWVKYIPVVLAFVAALLGGLQTYFNYNKKVEGHLRTGNDYLAVMKKCGRLQGYISENLIVREKIIDLIEELGEEMSRINKSAESYTTSKKDYVKAKQGIDSGEEAYSETELKI